MNSFQKFLEGQKKYKYIEEGDTILVAFSGGPDSMFLVEMLLELKKIFSFNFLLVHIHHGLRNEYADSDYNFCREYAKRKNLVCILHKEDVRAYAKKNKMSLEEAGRNVRYSFFEKIKEERACTKIATAHHLDDHLETFFFRLLRGSSISGLTGIARKKGDKIRPLRDFNKQEILSYLEENKISFCRDETNEETTYMRNKLRLELLPQFSKYNPKWKEKVAAFMEELEAIDYENKKSFKDYLDSVDKAKLSISKLQKESVYFQKKILYEYILSRNVPTNRKQIDKIFSLLEKGGSLSYDLKKSWKFKKEYDRIWVDFPKESFLKKIESKTLKIPGITYFGKYKISTFILTEDEEEEKLSGSFLFPWKESEEVRVRTYEEGDRIRLPGLEKTKKVKEIFINQKIPRQERRSLPILEYQGNILCLSNVVISKMQYEKGMKKVIVKIEEG